MENKQLQYVYSSNPEGRRGPDCNITYIYFQLKDSKRLRGPAVCLCSFLAGILESMPKQKNACQNKHIGAFKTNTNAHLTVL